MNGKDTKFKPGFRIFLKNFPLSLILFHLVHLYQEFPEVIKIGSQVAQHLVHAYSVLAFCVCNKSMEDNSMV